jgi:hypothetical protein
MLTLILFFLKSPGNPTKKPVTSVTGFCFLFVGVARFELTTSTSQMWRDTGLRYTPNSSKI